MKDDICERYTDIVDEIRKRIYSAEVLLKHNDNLVMIESIVLQIRKIIELISYMTLILNKDKLNSKERQEYRAKQIIESISQKTTIFYPFPSYVIPPEENDGENPILFPIGYKYALTQEKLIFYYRKCGTFLHSQHPFKKEIDIESYKSDSVLVLNNIKQLLTSHVVPVNHGDNMYTFLHAEIDFDSTEESRRSYVREYKVKIHNEEDLKNIFNLNNSII